MRKKLVVVLAGILILGLAGCQSSDKVSSTSLTQAPITNVAETPEPEQTKEPEKEEPTLEPAQTSTTTPAPTSTPVPVPETDASAFVWEEENGEMRLVGFKDMSLKEAVIPKEVNGLPVTEVMISTYDGAEIPDNLERLVIPEGVILVGVCSSDADRPINSLKSVKIPSSVVVLSGFHDFDNLTSIEMPDCIIPAEGVWNRESLAGEIPNGMVYWSCFNQCDSLTSVEIPDGVTYLGWCFSACENLTNVEIPDSVTYMESCFGACKSLKSVEIPGSVTFLGGFVECDNLEKVELSEGLIEIDEGSFSFCPNLASIEIPYSVKKIGSSAFLCCGLKNLKINGNMTEICDYKGSGREGYSTATFGQCSNLISVELSGCMIGEKAFENCENLKTVKLFNSSIGEEAFCECSSLTDLELSNIASRIGAKAFESCNALTSVEIPEGVDVIGDFAFDGSNLTSIKLPESVTELGDAFGWPNAKTIIFVPKDSYAEQWAKGKKYNVLYYTPEN